MEEFWKSQIWAKLRGFEPSVQKNLVQNFDFFFKNKASIL